MYETVRNLPDFLHDQLWIILVSDMNDLRIPLEYLPEDALLNKDFPGSPSIWMVEQYDTCVVSFQILSNSSFTVIL